MKKLTKARIEEMANEIICALQKRMICDTILYFNNKKVKVDYGMSEGVVTEEDVDPHSYFQYAAYNHILSMSFEGSLYDDMNYGECVWLQRIFDKYGVWYELGNSWNLTTYPEDDDMEVEYTVYERPMETEYFGTWRYPDIFSGLVELYKTTIQAFKDRCYGSCVIGDGIEFKLGGKPYKFSTNWNQMEAPSEVIDVCKKELERMGATEIYYNCGHLD